MVEPLRWAVDHCVTGPISRDGSHTTTASVGDEEVLVMEDS